MRLTSFGLDAGGLAGFLARRTRLFAWPSHDMVRIVRELDLFFLPLATTAHGNPRLVHACLRPGDEGMPPGEIAPFCDQPIGARRRQPAERPDLVRG